MDVSFIAHTFWASMISSLKMVVRMFSLIGLLGFALALPFFSVLTSWIIFEIMTENVGYSTFFATATGMSDYLSYVIIGFGFSCFIFAAVFGGAYAIREEQEHGTAEQIFVTPANKLAWLLGKIFGSVIFNSINFSFILLSGVLLFGFQSDVQPNIPTAILGILVTVMAMVSFGVMFAGICFLAKREREFSSMLWPLLVFFCGLAFPLEILPPWAQSVAWMMPITYGVDSTRRALLLGKDFSDSTVLSAFAIMSVQTIVFFIVGGIFFFRLEKEAKKKGTLGTY